MCIQGEECPLMCLLLEDNAAMIFTRLKKPLSTRDMGILRVCTEKKEKGVVGRLTAGGLQSFTHP